MKILIGYDGSDCSRGAIADLRRAGLFDDTEALVVSSASVYLNLPRSCFEPAAPGALQAAAVAVRRAHELGEQAMADARERAEEAARQLRATFPKWTASSEASAEPAHRALLGRSESWGADLVVVGSHGRNVVGRALLGSVSQQVLHAAHCSVRIGRCADAPSATGAGPVRILLGVDGSPDAAAAVAAVAARRWPQASEVLVLSVLDVRLTTVMSGFEPAAAPWLVDASPPIEPGMDEQALRRVAAEIERPGLAVTTRLAVGDPKHVLVDEAHAWNADCIFVGAKGHGRLERMILGSVSASCAARAHCSVEVVRSS